MQQAAKGPPFHSGPLAPCRNGPVSSNVRHRDQLGIVTNFDIQPLGSVSLTGKISVSQPEPQQRYLFVAKSLATGLRPLASAGSTCTIPLAFLAAQITETTLKAYLLKSISPRTLASSKDRHRIDALWSQATALGLPLPSVPTPSIQILVNLHQNPYPLRYSDEGDTRLIALPNPDQLVTEVEHVFKVVSSHI